MQAFASLLCAGVAFILWYYTFFIWLCQEEVSVRGQYGKKHSNRPIIFTIPGSICLWAGRSKWLRPARQRTKYPFAIGVDR